MTEPNSEPAIIASSPSAVVVQDGDQDFVIAGGHASLHNDELAPTPPSQRKWGWFEIFNVWTNDVQSLAGYTLAASLFITAGINGWFVLAAIILSGALVMMFVNWSGQPSVKYGVPYPVVARASMGVRGAMFPATVRGIVAIFWYGAQTYFASTAVALAITAIIGASPTGTFLGMTWVDWVSYTMVAAFQIFLFVRGIDGIVKFLNFAGPAVYAVMVLLLIAIWWQAGSGLLRSVGELFAGEKSGMAAVSAFIGVVGTMIAYFAAVIINFGDFARFTRSDKEMKRGNFLGLPVSLAFFTFLSLFITAGAYIVFQDGQGDPMTNPADIVGQVGNLWLSILAAVTFFVATVGINLVANFIPPVYDIVNLKPDKLNFRIAGCITAVLGFIIGALWVSVIGNAGLPKFVDTLGAVLAPLYGVMVADYFLIRKKNLEIQQLYSLDPGGTYYYTKGWNVRALWAFGIAAVFAIAAVWVPALSALSGFAWVFGAALGAAVHWLVMRGQPLSSPESQRTAVG
ncbi:NCS1 family nucleobase:cation symporter-1 [Mycobacterium sp. Y57]|uniref:NCS1 family nucleobase:cation symporter-1 n=1 Tax=Mycolicibacterium xanthum TaxID=2796469 RepID=UPI001C845BF4|nr:NCS1 family nucleobase:cation symporter-1 [Mycolicibacterium xanthum]MBX7431201.1 NCS1 family nucleobase:cation symporter-1 [Mycolicibacterium xanthum]